MLRRGDLPLLRRVGRRQRVLARREIRGGHRGDAGGGGAGDELADAAWLLRRLAVAGPANLQAVLLVDAVGDVANRVVADERRAGLVEPVPEVVVVGAQADGA